VNRSIVWKYRRHFRSAIEHTRCLFGRVININSRSSPNQAEIFLSLCNRYLAHVTVVNGIQRKATYGQIQGDYERLELCRQLYAYVTSDSVLGLFRRLDFCGAECTSKHTVRQHKPNITATVDMMIAKRTLITFSNRVIFCKVFFQCSACRNHGSLVIVCCSFDPRDSRLRTDGR
jgi:hypothetical protein